MYEYLFIDAQYYLVRNAFRLMKDKYKSIEVTKTDGTVVLNDEGTSVKVAFPNFTYSDLMQMLYWSVAKLVREHPCKKAILLFDKSPYYRNMIVDDYKGSRVYYNESDLEKLDQDTDPVKFFQVKSQVEFNNIKTHAKYSVCKFFPQFGMPVFISKGYEADDLAYIAAQNFNGSEKRVAICSVDSDWKYRINPNCDVITPKGAIITYEEMKGKVPEGWDLYEFHKYNDTFYGGHNDLKETLTEVAKDKNISELKDAVESGIEEYFTDLGLVKAQLRSFDIDDFRGVEGFEEIDSIRRVLSDEELHKIDVSMMKYEVFKERMFFGITWNYYYKFMKSLR